MNEFAEQLRKETNFKETENGCLTNKSSLSHVLDFFAMGAAMRQRQAGDIVDLFSLAMNEETLLALRTLFYFRDVRGGQGERRAFRSVITWLGNHRPDLVQKNLENIPFYGRWDDLFALIGTRCERDAFLFIKRQLESDAASDHPSLLAKWVKITKAKRNDPIRKVLMKHLGFTSEKLRKTIVAIRKKLDIVERKMCSKEWDQIDYEHVPSKASLKLAKAFRRNDEERYDAYIEAVKAGKKSINAATLYPYEIVRKVLASKFDDRQLETLDAMWKALPDYCPRNENALVLADTSGSMTSNYHGGVPPILVSLSLAIYFAERNHGPFNGYFMGFSGKPSLYKIEGDTIEEKVSSVKHTMTACENTDLIACFKLILLTAVKNHLRKENMPKRLYIVSDMEFDVACHGNKDTAFQTILKMYENTGYDCPELVFWNVNARQDQCPITKDENNVFLVSGASPSIFRYTMESKIINPIEVMLEVLNSERYQQVIV